jgi:enolase-phosphatase E1
LSVSLPALGIRALVLDIEGTTTPVAFVYDVLFPYARSHVAAYLRRAGTSEACRRAVTRLEQERASEPGTHGESPPADTLFSGADMRLDEVVRYVNWLMDRDRKSPGLKALQGLIWQDGFGNGELRGEVYPDVVPAFERWRAHGRTVSIYSSGSVLAQRLLFGSTNAGDLTRFIVEYFDTGVGAKTSADSYHVIAGRLHETPGAILFVSDTAAELDAARAAGMKTVLAVRAPDASFDGAGHPAIRSFDELVEGTA